MTDTRVAKRYARALFSAARQEDIVASVESDLEGISHVLAANDAFRRFIGSPNTSLAEKTAMYERAFADRVTALTMQLLRLLLDKRRETEFEHIRQEFARLRREHDSVVHATISSAYELAEDDRQRIVAKVAEATGKRVEPEFAVDPKLIGGVRVTYGEFVLDGSVRGQLEKLREHIVIDVLKQN